MKHDEVPNTKDVRHENRVDYVYACSQLFVLIFSPQTINTFSSSGNSNVVNVARDNITNIINEKGMSFVV